MMTREYDPLELRKLQLAQCKVLEDFIEICEKNHLEYFMTSGCAIGMERHGGFIPWDDDIDLGMMRDDYNKFIEIALKEYSDKYRVLDISVDDDFPFYNCEFIRKGTKMRPVIFKDCDVDMGIDVAIYPFDNVADGKWQRKYQLFMVFFWHKLRVLKDFKDPVLFFEGWKLKLVKFMCHLAHYFLKFFHVSNKFINRHYMKHATRYNKVKTENVSCFFSTYPTEMEIKTDDLFPLKTKKFEYLDMKIPNKNHEYLTHMYGDYMQLPPKEKRKNHVPYLLEFGPFEDLEVDRPAY